jgi:hypothetical protein
MKPIAQWTLAPWAGLIAGMLGAGLQHQSISDALHFECSFDASSADLLVGALALSLIIVGSGISWSVSRTDDAKAETRRFIAHLSLMGAALFALMVLWQTLAGFIVPPCA